jgi:hypothetical protein
VMQVVCAGFTLQPRGQTWLQVFCPALEAYVRPLQRLQPLTPLAALNVPAWQGYTAPKRFLK